VRSERSQRQVSFFLALGPYLAPRSSPSSSVVVSPTNGPPLVFFPSNASLSTSQGNFPPVFVECISHYVFPEDKYPRPRHDSCPPAQALFVSGGLRSFHAPLAFATLNDCCRPLFLYTPGKYPANPFQIPRSFVLSALPYFPTRSSSRPSCTFCYDRPPSESSTSAPEASGANLNRDRFPYPWTSRYEWSASYCT